MDVARIHTDHGSRIEPPFDPHWTNLQQLQWHAAVISADSGLQVTVDISDTRWKTPFGWRRIPGQYAVHVEGTGISPLTFTGAWDYMNGVLTGAEAAREAMPALVAEVRRLREHEATIRALIARQCSDEYSGERGWVWHPDLEYVLDEDANVGGPA